MSEPSERNYEPYKPGEDEVEIKKSRFVGNCIRIKSQEEAEEYLFQLRKKHYNARHVCYGYILEDKIVSKKCSDDGEPSQTAGKPILEVMEHKRIINSIVTVTRYFGGILLGTGGLSRAYRTAAQKAIEAAVLMERKEGYGILLDMDYTLYGKMENCLRTYNVFITESEFSDSVKIKCLVDCEKKDIINKEIINLSNGQLMPKWDDKKRYAVVNNEIKWL